MCIRDRSYPNPPPGGRRRARNHSSRPASTASLSTGKETSCGPLVCLCYTRVAMHGRSFQFARVIVIVLPLPSVLDVFPSVEPTTIVNVCIQFAGFEQKWHFEEIYCILSSEYQPLCVYCIISSYARLWDWSWGCILLAAVVF